MGGEPLDACAAADKESQPLGSLDFEVWSKLSEKALRQRTLLAAPPDEPGAVAERLAVTAEALMKVVISKLACDLVREDGSPQDACASAMRVLAERTAGRGGLIALDARGRIGVACNTTAMPHAYAIGDAPVVAGDRPPA